MDWKCRGLTDGQAESRVSEARLSHKGKAHWDSFGSELTTAINFSWTSIRSSDRNPAFFHPLEILPIIKVRDDCSPYSLPDEKRSKLVVLM